MRPNLRQFIGCPFRDGARGESIDPITHRPFYDCAGLMLVIFHAYGLTGMPDYGKDISCFASDACYEQFKAIQGDWKRIDAPEEPCMVAMRMKRDAPELVQHFGVYIGDGKFIHTRRNTASIMSDINDPVYNRIIEGFYKWIKS
jgi:hypothetical protein